MSRHWSILEFCEIDSLICFDPLCTPLQTYVLLLYHGGHKEALGSCHVTDGWGWGMKLICWSPFLFFPKKAHGGPVILVFSLTLTIYQPMPFSTFVSCDSLLPSSAQRVVLFCEVRRAALFCECALFSVCLLMVATLYPVLFTAYALKLKSPTLRTQER